MSEPLADEATAGQIVRCATHPAVETALRCSRCGQPICPRCLDQTPVGARCRACARPQRLPTFTISGPLLVRAAVAGFVAALVGGMVVLTTPLGGLLQLTLFALDGFAVGEATSWGADRRRAPALGLPNGPRGPLGSPSAFVAVGCLVVGTFLAPVALGLLAAPPPSFPAVAARLIASPFFLLGLVLGAVVAVSRVR